VPKAASELTSLLRAPRNANELELVVSDLFTPAEIETLLERWRALSLLIEGTTHREVQKKAGVSISKVTHAANLLKSGGKGARLLYKRMLDLY
jgi:Trp operon repressor